MDNDKTDEQTLATDVDAGAAPPLAQPPLKGGGRDEAFVPTTSEPELAPTLDARLIKVQAARNALLEAAMPLLRVLSEMPQTLPKGEAAIAEFRAMLDQEVRNFQALCDRASLRREHVLTARYALCTAIDESASSTEWGKNCQWGQKSLAQQFHQDTEGGEKFFLVLGRLSANVDEHVDLLELMYRILGLGFKGYYTGSSERERELDTVRHRLLMRLRTVQEVVEPALSPRWQGVGAGRFRMLRSVPLWVSASVLGLVLVSVFAWKKYVLLEETTRLQVQIEQLAKLAPEAKPLNLAQLFKDEINTGVLSVSETGQQGRVVFKGDDTFAAGSATLSAKAQKVLTRVATEVRSLGVSRVLVIGHTDAQPINVAQFPSNEVLSLKRAKSVEAYLSKQGIDKVQIESVGKGASEPVGDNATAQGRAVNRRIEIVVTR